MQEIKRELQQIKTICDTIERAVMGEPRTGHDGLLKDMDTMKKWKVTLDLRIAMMSGVGTTLVILVKYLLTGHV